MRTLRNLIFLLLISPCWASVQTCTGLGNIITTPAGNTQLVTFGGVNGCASFTPLTIFITTTGQTGSTTALSQAVDLKGLWGVSTPGTGHRAALAYSSQHGVTPAVNSGGNRTDGSLLTMTPAGAVDCEADVTSTASGSFTLTIVTQCPSAYTFIYMAIGISDTGAQADVKEFTKTIAGGSSGNQTYTLPFAHPNMLMFFGGSPCLTAAPSACTTQSSFFLGAWDTQSQWYNFNVCAGGGASSSCQNSQNQGSVIQIASTGSGVALGAIASVVSVVGTTLTLNWKNQNGSPSANTPFYVLEIAGGKWSTAIWNVSHTLNTVTSVSGKIPPTGIIAITGGNLGFQPATTGTFEPVWGFVDQVPNFFAGCAKDINGQNPTKDALGFNTAALTYRIESGGTVGIQYDTVSLASDGFSGKTSVTGTASDETTYALLVANSTQGSNVSGPSNMSGTGSTQ